MSKYVRQLTPVILLSVLSAFFSLGQTLETFRGKGIYQDAVNVAIQRINQGGWVRLSPSLVLVTWSKLNAARLRQVHMYGEGKVNQPCIYPLDKLGQARLPRFKWGMSVIVHSFPITHPAHDLQVAASSWKQNFSL